LGPHGILAFIDFVPPESAGAEAAFLPRCLAALIRRRLRAAGRELAPARETQRLWDRFSTGKSPAEFTQVRRQEILSLLAAESLLAGQLQHKAGALELDLLLLAAEDEPKSLRVGGTELEFEEFLNAAGAAIADALALTEPELDAMLRVSGPRNFAAFASLAAAQEAWSRGDLDAAEAAVQEAQNQDDCWGEPLRFLAQARRLAGDLESAGKAILAEIALHSRAQARCDQGAALVRLGELRVEQRLWELAAEIFREAAESFESIGESQRALQARSNEATVLQRLGRSDQAIGAYEASLQGAHGARERAQLLYNLGLAKKAAQQPESALAALDEALGAAKRCRAMELICRIHNARGTLYDTLDQNDRALQELRQAEEYDTGESPTLGAGIKDHLAIVCRKLGRLDDALRYSAQACQRLAELDAPLPRAAAFVNRAAILAALGRREEARRLAQHAREIFEEQGSPHQAAAQQLLNEL